jgi:hypothetical protein
MTDTLAMHTLKGLPDALLNMEGIHMEKETLYCHYNHVCDPGKDYGMCTNKDSSNYGKPVFMHECEIVVPLPCQGKKRADDSVYIDSLLAPDGITERISEGMLNIIKFPKDKRICEWKNGITIRLKMLLLRVSKETDKQTIVTSVYHNADKILNVLNKEGSIEGYSIEQYQVGKAIHWKLLLNGKEIAGTKEKGIIKKLFSLGCFSGI